MLCFDGFEDRNKPVPYGLELHSASVVTQRLDRIELRRPPRRPDTEEEPDTDTERHREQHRVNGDEHTFQLANSTSAQAAPSPMPSRPPSIPMVQRLHDELHEDVEPYRSKRLTHANLARALGDGHPA